MANAYIDLVQGLKQELDLAKKRIEEEELDKNRITSENRRLQT